MAANSSKKTVLRYLIPVFFAAIITGASVYLSSPSGLLGAAGGRNVSKRIRLPHADSGFNDLRVNQFSRELCLSHTPQFVEPLSLWKFSPFNPNADSGSGADGEECTPSNRITTDLQNDDLLKIISAGNRGGGNVSNGFVQVLAGIDGNGHYKLGTMQVPHSECLRRRDGGFSLEFNIRVDNKRLFNLISTVSMFGKFSGSDGDQSYRISLMPGGRLDGGVPLMSIEYLYKIRNAHAGSSKFTSALFSWDGSSNTPRDYDYFTDTNWHHVVLVYDPAGDPHLPRTFLYLDSIPYDITPASDFLSTANSSAPLSLVLGALRPYAGDFITEPTPVFALDEMAYYPSVMPPEEVLMHYVNYQTGGEYKYDRNEYCENERYYTGYPQVQSVETVDCAEMYPNYEAKTGEYLTNTDACGDVDHRTELESFQDPRYPLTFNGPRLDKESISANIIQDANVNNNAMQTSDGRALWSEVEQELYLNWNYYFDLGEPESLSCSCDDYKLVQCPNQNQNTVIPIVCYARDGIAALVARDGVRDDITEVDVSIDFSWPKLVKINDPQWKAWLSIWDWEDSIYLQDNNGAVIKCLDRDRCYDPSIGERKFDPERETLGFHDGRRFGEKIGTLVDNRFGEVGARLALISENWEIWKYFELRPELIKNDRQGQATVRSYCATDGIDCEHGGFFEGYSRTDVAASVSYAMQKVLLSYRDGIVSECDDIELCGNDPTAIPIQAYGFNSNYVGHLFEGDHTSCTGIGTSFLYWPAISSMSYYTSPNLYLNSGGSMWRSDNGNQSWMQYACMIDNLIETNDSKAIWPYVSVGKSENILSPVRWLGMMKLMFLMGARSANFGAYEEAKPFGKRYLGHIADMAYAQAVAFHPLVRKFIDRGRLLYGDITGRISKSGYQREFYTGDAREVAIVREINDGSGRVLAAGTRQIGSQSSGPSTIVNVNDQIRELKLPLRKQGSVFVLDPNPQNPTAVYVDRWHQGTNPLWWGDKMFYEAEVYELEDENCSNLELITDWDSAPAGGVYDLGGFNTYVGKARPGCESTLQYPLRVSKRYQNTRHVLWVRGKYRNSPQDVKDMTIELDGRPLSINGAPITEGEGRRVCFGPVAVPVHDSERHILSVTPGDNALFDGFIVVGAGEFDGRDCLEE